MDIGIVTSIEMNHKSVDSAKKGQEICVKIESIPGESPKMYGRHFEATDVIVTKVRKMFFFSVRDLPAEVFHIKSFPIFFKVGGKNLPLSRSVIGRLWQSELYKVFLLLCFMNLAFP